MLKPWLQQKWSIADLEARHRHDGVPFGFLNDRWERLKASMQEGDELWEFSSPPETWQHLMGRAGVALVRDGDVVDFLVTVLN